MADNGGSSKDAPAQNKPSDSISRKRKAEQISADDAEDADEGIPHLPAPVWGHVLDFMPYEEVRSTLLVGKHIALEAVKYVHTLNIMKISQMYIPATRRFINVEEVNVLCLLEDTGERGEDGDDDEPTAIYDISPETADRIPTFISSFAKAKSVFLGGLLLEYGEMKRVLYSKSTCNGPDNHEEVFLGLGSSLFAAYQTGALRREIDIIGLAVALYDVWSCSKEKPCQRCRTLVQNLSAYDVIFDFYCIQECFCLTKDDFWKLIMKRPGKNVEIRCASERVLCDFVFDRLSLVRIPETAVANIRHKWNIGRNMSIDVWHVPKSAFLVLDEVIGRGLDPTQITNEYFVQKFGHLFGVSDYHFFVWKQSTVEGLVARGFSVNTDLIPCIEDRFCK